MGTFSSLLCVSAGRLLSAATGGIKSPSLIQLDGRQ